MAPPTIDEIRGRLRDRPETAEQLPLLQACIKTRWEIYAEVGHSQEVPQCQLCAKFTRRQFASLPCSTFCGSCVIKQVTRKDMCVGTPFGDYINTLSNFQCNQEKHTAQLKQEARAELAFLRDIETVLIELKAQPGKEVIYGH